MEERIIQTPFPNLQLAFVRGGKFLRGKGDSQHKVQISSFYISIFPVTQWLWMKVMGENPSNIKGLNRPVETVSWYDTQDFMTQLNNDDDIHHFLDSLNPAALKFRLPTEAEWEYAARGGNKSKGFVYAGSDKLNEVGWFYDNSYFETKPVGLKLPNELGLYDMSGNVWEWCEDKTEFRDTSYYKQCAQEQMVIDPLGAARGTYRVMRGGSSFHDSEYCRSAFRNYYPPENRNRFIGFRLVAPCRSGG